MRITFISLILMTFPISGMAIDSFTEPNYCDGNQSEMNACAAEEFDFYEQILGKLYGDYLNKLSGEKNSEARNALNEYQSAWVIFREKQCAFFDGPIDERGSMWSFSHDKCLTEETKERAILFENLLKNLE